MQTNQGNKKKSPVHKLRRQISVNVNDALHARIHAACAIQDHAEGQLCRILIEWALPFYEKARSVEVLKRLGAVADGGSELKNKPPVAEHSQKQAVAAD